MIVKKYYLKEMNYNVLNYFKNYFPSEQNINLILIYKDFIYTF